ncbi:MAG: hypothetical protein GY799_23280 [Desulfobulbaceae bacterium]|nr:hypothetical protein [Desulfobulbaceae bacterium]
MIDDANADLVAAQAKWDAGQSSRNERYQRSCALMARVDSLESEMDAHNQKIANDNEIARTVPIVLTSDDDSEDESVSVLGTKKKTY